MKKTWVESEDEKSCQVADVPEERGYQSYLGEVSQISRVHRKDEGDQVAGMPYAFEDGCLEDAENDGKDKKRSREDERWGEEVESVDQSQRPVHLRSPPDR